MFITTKREWKMIRKEEGELYTKLWSKNPKEIECLGDLGVSERIILKRYFK
jgi:hypothetical protein